MLEARERGSPMRYETDTIWLSFFAKLFFIFPLQKH